MLVLRQPEQPDGPRDPDGGTRDYSISNPYALAATAVAQRIDRWASPAYHNLPIPERFG